MALTAWLWLAATNANAQCEFTGDAHLTLRTAGLPGAVLQIDGPVAVRPMPRGQSHLVEVRGSLSFVGETDDVRYSLTNRLETGHGMVSLPTRAEVQRVHAEGDELRLSVLVNKYSQLTLNMLRARCEDVRLFVQPTRTRYRELEAESGDGTIWMPRSRLLLLRATPGGGPALRLRMRSPRLMTLDRHEIHNGFFLVSYNDGFTRIRGWARRGDLRPGELNGFGGTGGSGTGSCIRGRTSGPHIYQGPARIRPGALVRQAPGGDVWANVREAVDFQVLHIGDSPWVQIQVAPGIKGMGSCGELERAWVRRDEVEFPVPRTTSPSSPSHLRPARSHPKGACDLLGRTRHHIFPRSLWARSVQWKWVSSPQPTLSARRANWRK